MRAPLSLAIMAVAVICILGWLNSEAKAQAASCGPLAGILEALQSRYGEWIVMTADAGMAKVYLTVSEKGSWTLIRADGTTGCIVGAGRNLEWLKGV